MTNRSIYTGAIIVLYILAVACRKDSSTEVEQEYTGNVTLAFSHDVRGLPLNFTDEYTNDYGEKYTVNQFKYYVHDISLINDTTATPLSQEYYLVNEEVAGSKKISLPVPVRTYKGISFLLGVDSARNVSGAQTGALDPAHGMFWTWSSGYVTAKLEGHSPASTLSGQVFTYHVGGYKVPHVSYRRITLPFSENMIMAKDTVITVAIAADINTWFSRMHTIRIANNPACHSPGQLANDIADNYEGMFSVKAVY